MKNKEPNHIIIKTSTEKGFEKKTDYFYDKKNTQYF